MKNKKIILFLSLFLSCTNIQPTTEVFFNALKEIGILNEKIKKNPKNSKVDASAMDNLILLAAEGIKIERLSKEVKDNVPLFSCTMYALYYRFGYNIGTKKSNFYADSALNPGINVTISTKKLFLTNLLIGALATGCYMGYTNTIKK